MAANENAESFISCMNITYRQLLERSHNDVRKIKKNAFF